MWAMPTESGGGSVVSISTVQRQEEEAFRRRSTVLPPLAPISAVCFPPRPWLDERIQYSTLGDRFKRTPLFRPRTGSEATRSNPDESLLPKFGNLSSRK